TTRASGEKKETVGSAPGLWASRLIDGAFRAAVQARPSGQVERERADPREMHRFEPRSRGVSVFGFSRRAPAGDPPSTAGLNRGGNGPGMGLEKPSGEATVSEKTPYLSCHKPV